MRCAGSESLPSAPANRLPIEFCVASLPSDPSPTFIIFNLCSKYPIYSEEIGSDGFTNRLGIQPDNTEARCEWRIKEISFYKTSNLDHILSS
ncbi:hypothetical protein LOK49_LG01G01718 [Camellia lanceoleosa]|uniref:Uncharacterized protein n=1 Tax=Camellia lanceoleosa TaxID=1840588 RepID=A0ACC0IXB6_9ERIC|nr:hypothetical protein LOK49_LG01G01718 [Camellia lanceoleosa]